MTSNYKVSRYPVKIGTYLYNVFGDGLGPELGKSTVIYMRLIAGSVATAFKLTRLRKYRISKNKISYLYFNRAKSLFLSLGGKCMQTCRSIILNEKM